MKIPPPAVVHTPGSWRVLYFDAPNRGEQVRMLLAITGTPFVDVRLSYPEGLNPYKKAAMGDLSPLLGTDLCPAVTAPDGTHCVETADIMRFIGQRVGLAPAPDSPEDKKAMELTLLAQQTMNTVFYALLKAMVVRELLGQWAVRLIVGSQASYLEAPSLKLAEALSSIEAAIEASGGPYVCGELSYADVSIFAILNEVLAYECFDKTAQLQPHPRLSSLMQQLEEKTAEWVTHRVREHQFGISSTVKYFAASNTPFPWAKKTKSPDAGPDFAWPP